VFELESAYAGLRLEWAAAKQGCGSAELCFGCIAISWASITLGFVCVWLRLGMAAMGLGCGLGGLRLG